MEFLTDTAYLDLLTRSNIFNSLRTKMEMIAIWVQYVEHVLKGEDIYDRSSRRITAQVIADDLFDAYDRSDCTSKLVTHYFMPRIDRHNREDYFLMNLPNIPDMLNMWMDQALKSGPYQAVLLSPTHTPPIHRPDSI